MFRRNKATKDEVEQAEALEAFARQLEGKRLSRKERGRLEKVRSPEFEELKQIIATVLQQRDEWQDVSPPPGALQRVEAALMEAIHYGRPVALPHAGRPAFAYSREPIGSDSELLQVGYDLDDSPPRAGGKTVVVGLRVLREGEVIEERQVVIPAVTIGRGEGVTLQFPEHERVSRRHLQMSAIAGEVYVQDLDSSNGTFLNEHPLRGRCALENGDVLRLGDLVLKVEAIDRQEQHLRVILKEVREGTSDRSHELVLPQVTLGRSRSATVQLRDPTRRLSRLHAQLDAVDGRVYITDLNSRNGTYVDGERIRRRTRLKVGSILRLGGVHLQVTTIDVQEEA